MVCSDVTRGDALVITHILNKIVTPLKPGEYQEMKPPKSKVAPWARAESAKATCGDARLNHRPGLLLTAMGEAPGASIPQACGGQHAEMAAAYRFFDNEATTPSNILAAHTQQSLERIAAHPTVLLVQDNRGGHEPATAAHPRRGATR